MNDECTQMLCDTKLENQIISVFFRIESFKMLSLDYLARKINENSSTEVIFRYRQKPPSERSTVYVVCLS